MYLQTKTKRKKKIICHIGLRCYTGRSKTKERKKQWWMSSQVCKIGTVPTYVNKINFIFYVFFQSDYEE